MRANLKLMMAVGSVFLGAVHAQSTVTPEQFMNPPADAKPMTWMHVMNQNLSQEGLEKDLQLISDAGLGGALIFSVSVEMPKGPVEFNSPEFRSIIQHGIKIADKLDLKLGVHNCDGWTSSGGPWMDVEESMKRVVFSETFVKGGPVDVALEKPRMYGFYREIGVVAIPAQAAERKAMENRPTVTASDPEGLDLLMDGQIDTPFVVKPGKVDNVRWVQFAYDRPFTVQSVYLEHWSRNIKADLYSSDNGTDFKKVAKLNSKRTGKYAWIFENNVNPVTARYFQVRFNIDTTLAYMELSAERRMPHWQGQVSMLCVPDARLRHDLAGVKPTGMTPLDQVLDLSASVSASGQLTAHLPDGLWRIYRFGYTSTGAKNSPATDGGRGFECDKLNAAALDKHFAAYVGKLAEESGPLSGKAFRFSEIDSYEMGGQNWTDDYAKMFSEKYGYSLAKFLPLFASRYIQSVETTDAVLGDMREFTCDLMTANYYKRFTELCNQHGMVSYIENYGFGPINGLEVGGYADIPMGEFWIDTRPATHYETAVSAAHTYGKPVVSAEAFTSAVTPNWGVHPYMLKSIGDHKWTQGINEFMFHRYAHQANTQVVPGMSMNKFGSHIDGTQTWWLNAGKAWMEYIQRGSWMLRQGIPVSDLLVCVGEGSPHKAVKRSGLGGIPNSNNFDYCDVDVLMNRIKVVDGKLVLPEGTTYQVLYMQNADRVSMQLLNRMGELAAAGATIYMDKPNKPLGYMELQSQRDAFRKQADAIWSEHAAQFKKPVHLKLVFEDAGIEPDFFIKGDPSATYIHRQDGDADIYFIHNNQPERRVVEASFRIGDRIPELWYPDSGTVEIQAQFMQQDGRTLLPVEFDPHGSAFVVFRQPAQGMDPISSIKPAGVKAVVNRENQRMELRSRTSGLVKITQASGRESQVMIPALEAALRVDGGWSVEFNGLGVQQPNTLDFAELSDWKDHARDDIRHFSGTAIYRKTVDVSEGWSGNERRLFLDLGQVCIAAEVMLNGKDMGILWKPPFSVDVTDHLRSGQNELEIRVTNPWVNRLVGDEQFKKTDGYTSSMDNMPAWYVNNEPLPEGERSTFSAFSFYGDTSTHVLAPSGLLGPVSLYQEAIVPLGK